MKWVFRGFFLILFIFGGLCVAGYLSPATIEVERSTQIDAYPEDIFPHINDLKNYESWSSLHQADPDAKFVYGGSENGIGQTAAWISDNPRLGNGEQEIIASAPNEFVQLKLTVNGQPWEVFYGLSTDGNDEGTIVLFRTKFGLGGFPYLQRLAARASKDNMATEFDNALTRLKTIVEAESGLE